MVQLFLLTMLLVVVCDNLGMMWVAIEGTTLASAFLVGFYEKDTSVEAAWKYLIICSVGIALALFGIVLTYASSIELLGDSSSALEWTTLRSIAPELDPTYLRLAFIFIMVGYGTKVGLAPMHTWLPDAHSQAPSPISAMLSAVLLNCAFYGILRFFIITELCVPGFATDLMLIFGLLSMAVAAVFIIVAKDSKRLLAYSSIEHMGIMSLGFGLGGFLGIFGALFQMLNHALTKPILFFSWGTSSRRSTPSPSMRSGESFGHANHRCALLGGPGHHRLAALQHVPWRGHHPPGGINHRSFPGLRPLPSPTGHHLRRLHVPHLPDGVRQTTEGVYKGETDRLSLVPMIVLSASS